ncbi:Myristoyl-CoA:protein N-myristoyltransferase, N-terminal domain-containing protein [Dunaliella salina]|nr:Myristoyl-CoA:protein N-myristoyltransferase, N-terminal domain-containing protein [Dunaliella salina]|eukprot:KAF5840192.1 Myristoyl-CoA:protein N-myristoyltransferase, N-terminal domain-containing protein [Dunaliella salina]
MFRFAYPANFLRWALSPPGFTTDWLVGVRASTNSKLVGFISAIPVDMVVNGKEIKMVEINFLCVHKKLRSKRLAPVLIKEITRRVNLHNIWQAAFTAGALLPRPIATCRYWHRSLSPKKLIDIGFSRLAPRMTMARTIKLYKLPDAPITPGIRPFESRDAPQVVELLNNYLQRYRITQKFSLEDVLHWFTPRENVVDAYVVEDGSGKVTDFSSYYNLPSTVLGHPEHSELKAAYMFYTEPAVLEGPQVWHWRRGAQLLPVQLPGSPALGTLRMSGQNEGAGCKDNLQVPGMPG